MRVNVTRQGATRRLMIIKKNLKGGNELSKNDIINSLIEMPPGGVFLPLQRTHQVSVGEGTGSSGASKSYTTLVINTIIQTRFPVLQRASQGREVFYTLCFAVTANTTQTFANTPYLNKAGPFPGCQAVRQQHVFPISRVFCLFCVLKSRDAGK